ncbi:ABC transporter permease subunit [Candidatus Trichorickettsia mobilis]|uniref:ABC transporter permease subunit n=1 Tax=Candidatus Trichorickettsia mobilis TaxID=1346319 RepID=UPI002930E9BC|nr:ABC transporter permease [Candidatus Trichorickettsia mobilis]
MTLIFAALEQSLLFFPLILGIYLSYHILNITDLSVDGTYVLGAMVFARTIDLGLIPAMIFSMIAGVIVGNIVGVMQRHNMISDLVVGILASFMLYSVNLQVLGRPNLSVLEKPTILSLTPFELWLIPLAFLAIILVILFIILLKSNFGLTLRAFGYNQGLLRVLGKAVENYRLIGLSLSGALAALSGALAAQVNGFADINMGFGIALICIGAIVIGRHLVIRQQIKFCVAKEMLACFVGIFLYCLCLSCLLRIGVNPANLKLLLGMALFFALRKVRVPSKKL